jgi:hypothetical protein
MSKKQLGGETYFERAQVDLEAELGGRFAKPRPMVSGEVPEQPATSPWSRDPVGREPPLGIDVNAVEPVGEAHEIEASLREIEQQHDDEETGDETETGLDIKGPE